MSISISPHSCQSASRAYVSALLYVISFLLWLTYGVIYAGVFFFPPAKFCELHRYENINKRDTFTPQASIRVSNFFKALQVH